jgi:hypothetical protein
MNGEKHAVSSNLPGKYKLKSGIVYMDIENSMMPGKTQAVLYFDDYGNKECTETNMEMDMMGQKVKVHQLAMIVGGYVYTIDLEKKMGFKMKFDPGMDPSKADYENLSPELKKEYNLKKEGSETIQGKKCDIYSFFQSKINAKGKVWVWNGISMKTEITASGITIKSITTKINENASVPASKFVVPNGIKITER